MHCIYVEEESAVALIKYYIATNQSFSEKSITTKVIKFI